MSRPPRKKAARKSPAERSAEIADAARAVAVEHGLYGVTLRSVAARIDVAPALVAHYQPNMDVLVASTFGAIVSDELAELQDLVGPLPTPSAQLADLLDTLLDGTRDDVTVIWVEAWALGRRNEALAQRVREEMDDWRAFVQGIVQAGVVARTQFGQRQLDVGERAVVVEGEGARGGDGAHGGREGRHDEGNLWTG